MILTGSDRFPGEIYQDKRVIVIKTHRYNKNEIYNYKRAILLIRNPFDAILAEYNREVKHNQTETAGEDRFKSEGK